MLPIGASRVVRLVLHPLSLHRPRVARHSFPPACVSAFSRGCRREQVVLDLPPQLEVVGSASSALRWDPRGALLSQSTALQRTAACCNVPQRVATCRSVLQRSSART
jgi:hypothetical protein